jgi:Negative regulator of sigma F
MAESVPPPSTAPRIVGRYAVYGEIASGEMGAVHFGRLLGAAGFARTVAVKRLHTERGRPTPPNIASAILGGVLHGLHAAHERARGDRRHAARRRLRRRQGQYAAARVERGPAQGQARIHVSRALRGRGAGWPRRSTPPSRRLTGAVLGAAAGAWAGVIVNLWCPIPLVAHLLVGHVGPILVLSIAGAVFARAGVGVRPLAA